MLKIIVVATALVFSMSASALPKGKPFQELAAQLSAIDAEIVGIQERIAAGDTALEDAIATLAELITENNTALLETIDDVRDQLYSETYALANSVESINQNFIKTIADVREELEIEVSALASSVQTTEEALAKLALDMADEIAKLQAADEVLAARLQVLEAIDYAKVTGLCSDGSVVVGLTETSITCASVEQSSDPLVYRKNVTVQAASATLLTALPQCDNASDRSYNGGFLASPSTANVSENFMQFNTDSSVPPRRQIKANNATRLTGYIVCESAAQ